MRTIWKYAIEMSEDFEIEMPANSRILCVQTQHGKPCIWVNVDPSEKKTQKRKFAVHKTSRTLCEDRTNYIGTFQPEELPTVAKGDLIFHLFERRS